MEINALKGKTDEKNNISSVKNRFTYRGLFYGQCYSGRIAPALT